MAPITLQILHASDFEAGISALDDAVGFSAVLNALRPTYTNTVTLSSGDNYLPGPFFNASSDLSLNGVGGLGTSAAPVLGRGDIGILNALGIQASALGNHEFDLGIRQIRDILRNGGGNPGTNFPYLSANLDFTAEINSGRGDIAATDIALPGQNAATIPRRITESTFIVVPGPDGVLGTIDDERIGIVGATTPTLPSISSTGPDLTVVPPNPTDYAALAAEIQTSVDGLTAAGIDKVILVTHMQQLFIERDELAPRLRDVDVILAGGSHTLLSDANDPLRVGDTSEGEYPLVRTSATGQPILVVNTDSNYEYVGRLVLDFDANGLINTSTLNSATNGAYASDEAGVDRVYGTDVNPRTVANQNVVAITDALRTVIVSRDSNIFGRTNVFLNGTRNNVRTEETNLGNLSADANLALANQVDLSVVVSLKNGGGIRDNIGAVEAAPGAVDANDVERLPPPANPQAGKEEGDVSQLDIENSLRFNNSLTLVTVTAAQLEQIFEHGVAGTRPGATPGQFPQVGGLTFSFDPLRTAIAFDANGNVVTNGDRVRSLALRDENDTIIDEVVRDGQLVGDPNRSIRFVTLNFLANGGDAYPIDDFIRVNPTFANRVDLAGEDSPGNGNNNGILDPGEDRNFNGILDGPRVTTPGVATFAAPGTEQDALAEYLAASFANAPFESEDVGPDQDGRIQNLSVRSDTVLAPAGLAFNSTTNLFTFNNILTQQDLRFTLTSVNTTSVNEIGVYGVEDDAGTVIDPATGAAILPGQPGYQQAALSQAQVVFSVHPDAFTLLGSDARITRQIGVNSGDRLAFYLVQNSTTDAILSGQPDPVFFASPSFNLGGTNYLQVAAQADGSFTLNFNDGLDADFDDLVLTVQPTEQPQPVGTGLQGSRQQELIDLSGSQAALTANYRVVSEAEYDNTVGLYEVQDAQGTVIDPLTGTPIAPGQAGYAAAALRISQQLGLTVNLGSSRDVVGSLPPLEADALFAPFLIADGSLDQFLASNPTNQGSTNPLAYFAYLGANPDGVDHVRLAGDNIFAFEDLLGGGDRDYNDIVFQVNLTVV